MADQERRKPLLSDDNIRVINMVLAKEQRVELIPTKDGVRVIQVQRKEVREHRSSL